MESFAPRDTTQKSFVVAKRLPTFCSTGPRNRLSENWPARAECHLFKVDLNAHDSGERSVLSVQAVTTNVH